MCHRSRLNSGRMIMLRTAQKDNCARLFEAKLARWLEDPGPDAGVGFSDIEVDRIARDRKIERAGEHVAYRVAKIVIVHDRKGAAFDFSGFRVEVLAPDAGKSIAC